MSRSRNTQSQLKNDRLGTLNVTAVKEQDGQSVAVTKSENFVGFDSLPLGSVEENVKITVSFDLSSKSYGNGASCMCSISMNVARDDDAVRSAFNLARLVCEAETAQGLHVAEGLVPHEG